MTGIVRASIARSVRDQRTPSSQAWEATDLERLLVARGARPPAPDKTRAAVILPYLYRQGGGRDTEAIEAVTGVCVDVDCDAREGHTPHDPGAILARLPFAWFAWSTQSHGLEKKGSDADHPRWRVFVPLLQPIDVGADRPVHAVVSALAGWLARWGIDASIGADPSGARPNQGQLLPSQTVKQSPLDAWVLCQSGTPLADAAALPLPDAPPVACVDLERVAEATMPPPPPTLSPAEREARRAAWEALGQSPDTAAVRDQIATLATATDGRARGWFRVGIAVGRIEAAGGDVREILELLPTAGPYATHARSGRSRGLLSPLPPPAHTTATATESSAPPVTLRDAGDRLHSEIAGAIERAGITAIRVTPGAGKSHVTREILASALRTDRDRRVEIVVPTRELAREWARDLDSAVIAAYSDLTLFAPGVGIALGRSPVEGERTYCADHAAYSTTLRTRGVEAAREHCAGCAHRTGCPYLSQVQSSHAHRVTVTTAALHTHGGGCDDPRAVRIVDESAEGATRRDLIVTRDQWAGAIGAGAIRTSCSSLANRAFALLDAGVTVPSHALARALDGVLEYDADADADALDAAARAGRLHTMADAGALRELARASQHGWSGVTITRTGDLVVAGVYRPLPRWEGSTVLLDATGVETHAHATLGAPADRWINLDVELHAGSRVTRIVAGDLTPRGVLPREGRPNAVARARWIHLHTPVPGVKSCHVVRLAILNSTLGRRMIARWRAAGDVWTYHGSGDARGSNAFEDCDRVVCDPYPHPTHAVRGLARALTVATGCDTATATRDARALLEHAAIVQAAHRVRPVRHAREIVYCADTPLFGPGEQVVTGTDLDRARVEAGCDTAGTALDRIAVELSRLTTGGRCVALVGGAESRIDPSGSGVSQGNGTDAKTSFGNYPVASTHPLDATDLDRARDAAGGYPALCESAGVGCLFVRVGALRSSLYLAHAHGTPPTPSEIARAVLEAEPGAGWYSLDGGERVPLSHDRLARALRWVPAGTDRVSSRVVAHYAGISQAVATRLLRAYLSTGGDPRELLAHAHATLPDPREPDADTGLDREKTGEDSGRLERDCSVAFHPAPDPPLDCDAEPPPPPAIRPPPVQLLLRV